MGISLFSSGEDPRYTHLHGCHVILPLLNKEIPIV